MQKICILRGSIYIAYIYICNIYIYAIYAPGTLLMPRTRALARGPGPQLGPRHWRLQVSSSLSSRRSPLRLLPRAAWHHSSALASNGARQTRSLSVAEIGLRHRGAVLTTVLVVCTVTDSANLCKICQP